MREVLVFLIVATALLAIVGIARRKREQSAPPSLADGGDDGVFSPMLIDGGSSSPDSHGTHGDSHPHGSVDTGAHHGGFDGGHFDGGSHH